MLGLPLGMLLALGRFRGRRLALAAVVITVVLIALCAVTRRHYRGVAAQPCPGPSYFNITYEYFVRTENHTYATQNHSTHQGESSQNY